MTKVLAATMIASVFTFIAVPDAEAKKPRKRVKVVKKVVKVKPYGYRPYRSSYRVPEREHISFGPNGISYYKQESYRVPTYYTGYGYPPYGYGWY